MSDSFDPYFQWLGIRDAQRPLDHYRLLGLPPLTNDRQAIEQAAGQTLQRVERFRLSRHAPRAVELIAEIEAARKCLLDERSKAAYDDRMRRTEASWPPGFTPPENKPVVPPAPAAPPPGKRGGKKPARSHPPAASSPNRPKVAAPSPGAAAAAKSPAQATAKPIALHRPGKPGLGRWRWIAGGVVLVALVGIAVAWALGGREEVAQSNDGLLEDREPVPRDASPVWTQPPPSIAPAASDVESEENPTGGSTPTATVPPPVPRQQAEATQEQSAQESPSEFWDAVSADPDAPPPWEMELPRLPAQQRVPAKAPGTPAVIGLIRDAYQALAERNVEEAQNLLKQAAARARQPVDKAEVRRLEALVLSHRRFWRGVERQIALAGPEHTFTFGSSLYHGPRVTLADSSGSKVRLRDSHGRETDFATVRATMDTRLALGLADRDVASSGAAGLSVLAAFLAIDREGDVVMAGQTWQQAAQQGWPVELIEETVKFDFTNLTVGERPILPGGNDGNSFLSGPPWEIPTSEELRTARREVIGQFGEASRAASTRTEMAALAEETLAAGTTAESPAVRYALYAEAQRLATKALDPATLCAAIDSQAAEFDIDGQQEKLQGLGRLTREQFTGDEAATVMAFLEQQIGQLASDEEFEAAIAFATLALRFAERRGGQVVAARLAQRNRWLRRQQEESELAKLARQTLRRSPDDPEANQTVGWYECLFLGDWEAGLPHLAQAQDTELRSLAERELSPPEDPQSRYELGRDWLALADRFGDDTAVQALLGQRAVYWVTDALPGLSATTQPEAEQLLTTIRSAVNSDDAPPVTAMMNSVMGRRWQVIWEPNPASDHTLADGFKYRFLEFLPDGTCRTNRLEGRWQLQGDVIAVLYPERPAWREYYRLTARGLEGEHFDPPEVFVVRGKGTIIAE